MAADFEAFQGIGKVLTTATRHVLLVDPYMDATVLTDFLPMVQEGVSSRLLADESSVKDSLEPGGRRWISQHGAIRPLQIRVTSPRKPHDRLIIIDGKDSWILTQSLKDFAK